MLARVCSLLLVLAGGAGCGVDRNDRWGPLVVYDSEMRGAGGGAALLGDRLRLVIDGGCVFVTHPDGSRTTPAWPSTATKWDEDTGSIEYRGVVVHSGDLVAIGGSGQGRPDLLTEPASHCPQSVWSVADLRLVD